jgi:lysophospholipase L1-like esterase
MFTVTVRRPPLLLYTRYLAFGDSNTEGKIPDPSVLVPAFDSQLRPLVDRIRAMATAAEPYPLGVQRRLSSRYASQVFRVDNAGVGAELAAEGGIKRFASVVMSAQPEVVLLMEGTNDLLNASGADAAISALGTMIQQALAQGRRLCLATIPPQRPNGARAVVAARIPPFNDRVRQLATTYQVVLVDVYNAMKDDLSLISTDDLHPNERGYGVIADTFAAAIRANFEQPTSTVRTHP